MDNLVSNAIKFCDSGDVIEISHNEKDPSIIEIKDSGPGIDAEIVEKLFVAHENVSTRGSRGEQGTGFGLPLAFEIMKMHGGKLSVQSKLGEGTVFLIHLGQPVRPIHQIAA